MSELEKQIVKEIKESLSKVIVTNLTTYNNPMNKLINDIFQSERDNVSLIMKSVLSEIVSSPEFRETIKEEFNRKVAKFLVGSMEGQVKRATEVLKQDPTFKSRMILAVQSIVDSELNKSK